MNILCVIDSLGSGGAQRQIVELAKGFHQKGHQVSFLIYHNLVFYKEEVTKYNIEVTCIQEPNYLKRIWKMRLFIRNGNYDVVLSFLEASNFICEVAGLPFRKWKLIVGERSANPKIETSTKLKCYRWFHLFSDYVVSNSYKNMDMVKKVNKLLPFKKCKVIYNLVDVNAAENRKETASLSKKLLIVVAASHQKLKNLNGLVEAVNLLNNEDRNKLCIHWYGDEADSSFENAKLKIQKYQLASIFAFFNATLDIKEKMLGADVVGLFSLHEGLPNAICEAMSLSKPIICSTVSDIPFILKNTLNALFNPYETNEIAKSLSYILSLKEEELILIGQKNNEIAQSLFSKEHIISKYLDLMEN